MKKIAKVPKSKRKNNKGFSLTELLVAMCMLSIIVLPVLSTFITSSRLNKRSREIACATEVAETFMEGFASKYYEDIVLAIDDYKSNAAVDSTFFNFINSGIFSVSDNVIVCDNDALNVSMFSQMNAAVVKDAVSINQIKFTSGGSTIVIPTASFNSCTNAQALTFLNDMDNIICAEYAAYFTNLEAPGPGGAPATDQNTIVWQDNNQTMAYMCFSNVHYMGNSYDVLCRLLPISEKADSDYYTYMITVTLYENEDGNHTNLTNNNSMVSMSSGTKNK